MSSSTSSNNDSSSSSNARQLSSANYSSSSSGADGFRPKEVKRYETGSDLFSRFNESIFVQPSLYMGLGTITLMFVTQSMPEHFLPQRLLGRRFHGIASQRFYSLPFAMIACSYVAVADRISDHHIMGGHACGLALSAASCVFMSYMGKLSPYWPTIGLIYAFFGGLHHYRHLKYYFDSAPIVSYGDMKEIAYDFFTGESRKAAKAQAAQARADREALIALAEEQRTGKYESN